MRNCFINIRPRHIMLAICLVHASAMGQEPKVAFHPTGNRSCLLENSTVHLLYEVTGLYGVTGLGNAPFPEVDWAIVAGQRTLSRGHSKLSVVDGSENPAFVVDLRTPPLRDGVTLDAELQVVVAVDGKNYLHSRPLHIFSLDPFANRQSFLEIAQIKLFDPEGMTADLLEKHDIPHSRLLNLSAIDLVTEGIVMVGEGISFRKQRKLAESLLRAAQRGVPVLCLAPSEGDIPLAVRGDDQPIRPDRLTLARGNIVHSYNKRFDNIPSNCHLSLKPRRNEIVLTAESGQDDWSWIDMSFPNKSPDLPSGRLIICGLNLVEQWKASPVPRYLFVHLLEELTPSPSTEEKNNALAQ